jgi:hypothetical protein
MKATGDRLVGLTCLPRIHSATTEWTLVFSEAGDYTITFSLIDADTEEVIAGITKTVEITVAEPEPVASTYKFSYEVPADVVAGQEVEVPVTFKTDVNRVTLVTTASDSSLPPKDPAT